MSERHHSAFTVAADHPALPGHFPGSPVVPGVVLLDHVLQALAHWKPDCAHTRGLRQAKFHAPLLPAQRADIQLEVDADVVRFQVSREGHLIAQGTFLVRRS